MISLGHRSISTPQSFVSKFVGLEEEGKAVNVPGRIPDEKFPRDVQRFLDGE